MGVTHGASVSGEFGSLVELLALVDDVGKYKAKIVELDGRIASAKQVFDKASAENESAKGHRAIAEKLMNEAETKLAEANATRATHASDVASLEQRTKAHEVRETAHHAAVAKFEAHRAAVEADLKARHADADKRNTAIAERHKQLEVSHEKIIAATNLHLENAKATLIAAEEKAAKVEARAKYLVDFVSQVKVWDRD